MATNTVPIEIVLQDPNNPIVPPSPDPSGPGDPGENTNILVPDTALGTGTTKNSNGTNSIFGGTNATASIASIIVLVLALGAIITLLVRRYQKHKKSTGSKAGNVEQSAKVSRKEKLLAATSGTLAVLAASVLVGNLLITSTNAATSNEGTTLDTPDKIQIIANRYDDVTIVASSKVISYASTDTSFGYKIFMSMVGEDANLYLDGDNASEYYFAPTTRAGLDLNSWGYNFDGEADYAAMPLAADPLMAQQNTSAVSDEEFTVYYTMKADKDMPFGVYSGEIAYDIQGYNGFPETLTTMQGMTAEICNAVYTPGNSVDEVVPTATLTDIRDGKTYEIAKLADGKCWMIQNLDLDLISDPTAEGYVALTPANTNISSNWTPSSSTIAIEGTSVPDWENSDTAPYSADPGDVFYYSSGTSSNDEPYSALEACKAAHPDCSMKNHAGNYYNWSAAVANNNTAGITEPYTNVETSICPAGWRLPKNRDNAESVTEGNEQITMISSYDDILGEYSPYGPPGGYYSYLDGGFNKIRTAPLWLARSGNVDSGSLYDTGNYGGYWSSTVDGNYVYLLDFNWNEMRPALTVSRSSGYSVRCVAQ